MQKNVLLLSATALLSSVIAITAQTTIYSFDYDTTTPGYSEATGSAPNKSWSITADGVGGSNGGTTSFDSTGASGSFSFGQSLTSSRNGSLADSTNASDYVLYFEVKAIGLLPTQTISAQAQLSFNFSGTVVANGGNAVSITDTFQSYALNLGSDFNSVPTIDLGNLNNSMQFRLEDFSAANNFGYDSGNAIVFDNIQLVQVPEPSSFAALTGILAIGLIAVRRRRHS